MASLRFREKQILEDFLEMGRGYVLNFSDRTLAEFFRDFGVDIDGPEYLEGHSGSKANRMRAFLDRASDRLCADVLSELIQYANSYRPGHAAAEASQAVATRLLTEASSRLAQPASTGAGSSGHKMPIASRPIEIFFSYAREDEALMDIVRLQLVVRERLGEIVKWHDRMIPAGDEWRSHIDDRIERAHVILLFVSPHFLASRYCYEIEGDIALRRHRDGTARVIPVVLRACDWTVSPFGELQGLPKDGVPLTQWADKDQASLEVARGIMESIGRTDA
ncbi:MAG: toll/interleukin-1 receptor domain-containing protein [Vicinamibacterales bacterium]